MNYNVSREARRDLSLTDPVTLTYYSLLCDINIATVHKLHKFLKYGHIVLLHRYIQFLVPLAPRAGGARWSLTPGGVGAC